MRGVLSHVTSLALVIASMFATTLRAEELVAARLEAAPPKSANAFADPAISPDGSEIAFVCGGDIWTVPAGGGDAHLLVAHAGHTSRPVYSPDGKRLAFVSTRSGNGDLYVLSFDTGKLKRLTFNDAKEVLDGWSRDGKWIYFTSAGHDISSMNDIYRINSDGGTPMPVIADRFANDSDSAPHPDGTTIAFCASGYSSQWWRKGHSHLDEAEIWLMRRPPESMPTFTRLTDFGARNSWPMWSPDGKILYYVSDRSGSGNIWSLSIDGKPSPVTQFSDGRVLWPTLSYDGKTLVFERDFGVWKMNVSGGAATGTPKPVSIRLRGAINTPEVKHHTFDRDASELALSPDGKKMAFVVHGQIFAASSDGGSVSRVTWTDALESRPTWAHDSRRLVYLSNREGARRLFLYDFTTRKESRLTAGPGEDGRAAFSHNDQYLAYHRNGSEIRVIDFVTGKDRLLAGNQAFEQPPMDGVRAELAWSPGDSWLAYVSAGPQGFSNVYVVSVKATTPKPRQISFFPNYESNSLYWSPHGSYMLFGSGQRTEPYQLARIDLIERTPQFTEDQFRDLFKDDTHTRSPVRIIPQPVKPQTRPATSPAPEEAPPTPARPTLINFNGIEHRVTLLPVGMEVIDLTLSPDGKWVAFLARAGGRRNVFVYPMDVNNAGARQLTLSAAHKWEIQFRSEIVDNKPVTRSVYYIANGEIHSVTLDGQDKAISAKAEMDIDFDKEKLTIFNQAWSVLRDHFHDPKFNGVDWKSVHEKFTPLVTGAKTSAELRRLLDLMVGELNASHLGVSAPDDEVVISAARLGVDFDRDEYERDGVLRVTRAVPLGPASVAGIETDRYIHSIDGTVIDRNTNLDQLLQYKMGRETVVGVARTPKGDDLKKVRLLPIGQREEKTLRYRDWVNSRREYVKRISNGRLGYIHMADMTEPALARLYTDLNSETYQMDGVVIDVRNNNGGFVNGYASDVFARQNYIHLTERGFPKTTGRVALGQRFLGLPTILLTNRHTLSDGEDFTEGYQAQGLGKTVGEPTAGWIIFTNTMHLLDGSSFRVPTSTVTDHNGKLMEMHPRQVDVPVVRPVGESYTGDDIQLKTAVEELTKQLRRVATANSKIDPQPGTGKTEIPATKSEATSNDGKKKASPKAESGE